MISIYDLEYEQLNDYFINNNFPKYRTKQLFEWLYQHRITSFDMITNMPKNLIEKLKSDFILSPLKELKRLESKDKTIKYLFELEDKQTVEVVLMHYKHGKSVCISTQVGCNMGCYFCASGQLKRVRNLTSGEMVAQVLHIQQELDKSNERISNVVVMGIGEPFDNYDNVLSFVRIINHPHSLAIGARHITISTCGLIDGIEKLSREPIQINLAISLHSAIDDKRSSLMPINLKYSLVELKRALKDYYENTNRRITLEYIILKGINDSKEDARALRKFITGLNAYVNIIPYNSVDNLTYQKISREDCFDFYQMLKDMNINATIRQDFGSDIDAACGQLRVQEGVI